MAQTSLWLQGSRTHLQEICCYYLHWIDSCKFFKTKESYQAIIFVTVINNFTINRIFSQYFSCYLYVLNYSISLLLSLLHFIVITDINITATTIVIIKIHPHHFHRHFFGLPTLSPSQYLITKHLVYHFDYYSHFPISTSFSSPIKIVLKD